MATTPVFIASGLTVPSVAVTAISTDRTGAGSYTTVLTGAPSIVEAIRFQAITLTIDTTMLVFLDDGANVKLIDEFRIRAATPTNVDPGFAYLWQPPRRIYLPSGDEIQCAMYSGSATIIAHVQGGLP